MLCAGLLTLSVTLSYLLLYAPFIAAKPWNVSLFPRPLPGRWVSNPDSVISWPATAAVEDMIQQIWAPVPPFGAAPCSYLQPGKQGFQVWSVAEVHAS